MSGFDLARRAVVLRAASAVLWLTRPGLAGSETVTPVPLDVLAHDLLSRLHAAELRPFLSEWPRPTPRRPSVPASLPVLRHLQPLRLAAPRFSAVLLDALLAGAPALAWRRSYESPAVSARFLDNYGWSEFIGLTGPLASERIACGVLLLGPDTLYPSHHHEAEEIYVPLAGAAAWMRGDGSWRDHAPGTLIRHGSNESHAMRTSASALLALYLWRSRNLAQKSQLD